MKLVSAADPVATSLCAQSVSDFGHEIGINGLTRSPRFCVLRKCVISSMKLISTADPVIPVLCPQSPNDFEHEIGVDS